MSSKRIPAVMRQQIIMEVLEAKGFAATLDVAGRLSVSDMTIRRDFENLADQKLLSRTHGGAVSLSRTDGQVVDLVEPDVSEREQRSREAKLAIAEHAFRLIAPGQTVALDIGTTTLALARLMGKTSSTVFTSSLKIASVLAGKVPQVYVPGGRVNGSEPSIVGAEAVNYFSNFNFDIAFIGASGITGDGLFDYSMEDAEVKRTFFRTSGRKVALLDSSKIERISIARICPLKSLDLIITDTPIPEELGEALSSARVQIEVAPKPT
jgi:DeoR/GlpR family transcriptional regulator of sugar metabolism